MMFSLISGLFVFAILGLLGSAVLVGLFIEKVPDGEQWVVTRFDQASLVGPGWRLRLPLVDQVMRQCKEAGLMRSRANAPQPLEAITRMSSGTGGDDRAAASIASRAIPTAQARCSAGPR